MKDQHIDQIIEIIDWYGELPDDYNGLNDLINARRKLSALLFNYSNLTLKPLGKEWKKKEGELYSKKYGMRVKTHSDGVVKARDISLANTWKEFQDEKDAEAEYWGAQAQMEAIKKVLNSMEQDISHLKEELKYSRNSKEV